MQKSNHFNLDRSQKEKVCNAFQTVTFVQLKKKNVQSCAAAVEHNTDTHEGVFLTANILSQPKLRQWDC